MLRKSSRRHITPFLNEMLNPTAAPPGRGEGSIESISEHSNAAFGIPSRGHTTTHQAHRGHFTATTLSAREQSRIAATRSTDVLRGLRDATLFSTRAPAAATASSLSHDGVLSNTLRTLDKAVKRAVELERQIISLKARIAAEEEAEAAAERRRQRNQRQQQQRGHDRRSAQQQQQRHSQREDREIGVEEGVPVTATAAEEGREDLVIARMLLGEAATGADDFGTETDQIAALAAVGHGSSSPTFGNSSSNDDTYRNKSRSGALSTAAADLQRLEGRLAVALDGVREGIRGVGLLSTVGASRVFEALLSKGQAVTALAVLSKWLHDSHFSSVATHTVNPNIAAANKILGAGAPHLSADGIPLTLARGAGLLFPFGDSHGTGVGGSSAESSAFVSGLPGRALMMASLVAAAAYDREAHMTIEAYKAKRIADDALKRQQRPGAWLQQQNNSSSGSNNSRTTAAGDCQRHGGGNASGSAEEDEDDGGGGLAFESDGDLYVVELCRRWLLNPTAVMQHRRESAAMATACEGTAARAIAESNLLGALLSASADSNSSSGVFGNNNNNVGDLLGSAGLSPASLLSQTDEAVLMILIAVGALNCRGSLPLLQKRFAAVASYSDRLRELTERLLGAGAVSSLLAKQQHQQKQNGAASSPTNAASGTNASAPAAKNGNNKSAAAAQMRRRFSTSIIGDTVLKQQQQHQKAETSPSSPSDLFDRYSLLSPAYAFAASSAGDRIVEIAASLRGIDSIVSSPSPSPSSLSPSHHHAMSSGLSSAQQPQQRPPMILTPAEIKTITTIDRLQGRLVAEAEALRSYAVRLIVRVLEALQQPAAGGVIGGQQQGQMGGGSEEGGCYADGGAERQQQQWKRTEHYRLRGRAERIVSEVMGAILSSCEGESPTAMLMAMSSHRLHGAATAVDPASYSLSASQNNKGSSGDFDDDADLEETPASSRGGGTNNTNSSSESSSSSSASFTQMLRERRAAKAQQKADRAGRIARGTLRHDFEAMARVGAPTRPPPPPTASAAAALGLLFPHKAWRAILTIPSLKAAQRADLAAGASLVRSSRGERVEEDGVSSSSSGLHSSPHRGGGGAAAAAERAHTADAQSFEELLAALEGSSSSSSSANITTSGGDGPLSSSFLPPPPMPRPTVAVLADQLFLTAMDSVEAGLSVVVGPLAMTSSASVRCNVAHMGALLHGNDVGDDAALGVGADGKGGAKANSASEAGAPPASRAVAVERFAVFVRGALSKVGSSGASGDDETTETSALEDSPRPPPFGARGVSERDAPLTAFALQSQIVQHTLRAPTSTADKRHSSLFSAPTAECPPSESDAASGVAIGHWAGLDVFEVALWQRPEAIYSTLVAMWREAVRSTALLQYRYDGDTGGGGGGGAKGGHGGTHPFGSTDAEAALASATTIGPAAAAPLNFNLLKRWLQIATVIGGGRDDGPALAAMMRHDLVGSGVWAQRGDVGSSSTFVLPEGLAIGGGGGSSTTGNSSTYKNFRRFIAKTLLGGIGASPAAPLLLDAHSPATAVGATNRDRLCPFVAADSSLSAVEEATEVGSTSASATSLLRSFEASADLGTALLLGTSSAGKYNGNDSVVGGEEVGAEATTVAIGFSTVVFTGANGITVIGRDPTLYRSRPTTAEPNGLASRDEVTNDDDVEDDDSAANSSSALANFARATNRNCSGGEAEGSSSSAANANDGEQRLLAAVGGASVGAAGPELLISSAPSATVSAVANPFASPGGADGSGVGGGASHRSQWEGLGFIPRQLALQHALRGYLWAQPDVSMLGRGGLQRAALGAEKEGLARSQSSSAVGSPLRDLVVSMPAQWWQFTVANSIWETVVPSQPPATPKRSHNYHTSSSAHDHHQRHRGGSGVYLEISTTNAKAIVSTIRLLHVGTAIHGRSLLSRYHRHRSAVCEGEIDEATAMDSTLLLAHFIGDGCGAPMAFACPPLQKCGGGDTDTSSSDAMLPLVPSPTAAALSPLPSLRALYKLLLCNMASLPALTATFAANAAAAEAQQEAQLCAVSPASINSNSREADGGDFVAGWEAGDDVVGGAHQQHTRSNTTSTATNAFYNEEGSSEYDDSQPMAFDDDGFYDDFSPPPAFSVGDGEAPQGGGGGAASHVATTSSPASNTFALAQRQRLLAITPKKRKSNNETNSYSFESPASSLSNAAPSSSELMIRDRILPEASHAALYSLLYTMPTVGISSSFSSSSSAMLFDATGIVALLMPIATQTALPSADEAAAAPLVPTISSVLAEASCRGNTLGSSTSAAATTFEFAGAVSAWAAQLTSALSYSSSSDASSPAAMIGAYSPYREARSQMIASLAASLDPVGCLLQWAVAGGRLLGVSFDAANASCTAAVGGEGKARRCGIETVPIPMLKSMSQSSSSSLASSSSANASLAFAAFSLDPSHAPQTRHVIALCRMMVAMGYRAPRGLPHFSGVGLGGGGGAGGTSSAPTLTIRVPIAAHVGCATSFDTSPAGPSPEALQLLWSTAVVPAALDALAQCIVGCPASLQIAVDLTFGYSRQWAERRMTSPHQQQQQQQRLDTVPHDAVRYVFRDFLLANGLGGAGALREREWEGQGGSRSSSGGGSGSIGGSHHYLGVMPSLQSSLSLNAARQAAVPSLRGLPSSGTLRRHGIAPVSDASASPLPEAATAVGMRFGKVEGLLAASRGVPADDPLFADFFTFRPK